MLRPPHASLALSATLLLVAAIGTANADEGSNASKPTKADAVQHDSGDAKAEQVSKDAESEKTTKAARRGRRGKRKQPTTDEAIARLKEGNTRFVECHAMHPHEQKQWRMKLESGQHPFAVVLGCSDSRVPPELVFDQGLGDLFVVRVAGNVVDTDVMRASSTRSITLKCLWCWSWGTVVVVRSRRRSTN